MSERFSVKYVFVKHNAEYMLFPVYAMTPEMVMKYIFFTLSRHQNDTLNLEYKYGLKPVMR